jgi:undecaprenyl diphosphate synthase
MEERPIHIAIIMDGNGRWGVARGVSRTSGHQAGAENTLAIIKHAAQVGVPVLTMWGFSTENWGRPENEVNALMGLFQSYAERKITELAKSNLKVTFIGRRDRLPERLKQAMNSAEEHTAGNGGMHLRLAINFSGTQESVDAANRIASRDEVVTDELLVGEIYKQTPQYDMVIRTGGECRLSDFPCRHAEIFFTQKFWPDFTPGDLDLMIREYTFRTRRFGGV